MRWFKREKSEQPEIGSVTVAAPPILSSADKVDVDISTKPAVQLSRQAETELYNLAQVVDVPLNRDLTHLASSNSGLFLFVDVGLRVYSNPERGRGHEFHIPADTVISPNVLANLSGFQLRAEKQGRILQISGAAFKGASAELRDYLNRRLLEGDAAMVLAVMAEYSLLERQAYRLGDRLHRLAMGKRSRFVESDVVRSTLIKIPRLPVSTSQLLAQLQDLESSSSEIAELVSQDPSLASLLLKAINSPQYSIAEPVSDVNRAIVMLGYQGVYQLIMAAGLKQTLPDTGRFKASYDKAIELSQIAFSLSAVSGKGSPAVISTIALLHDVGLIVSELLKKRHPDFSGLIATVDRCEFGGELLRLWGLPDLVTEAIRSQRYPDSAPPEVIDKSVRDAVALLYIADQFHTRVVAKRKPVPALYLREYLEVLGWRDKTLDTIWKAKLAPHLRSRKAALPLSLRAV